MKPTLIEVIAAIIVIAVLTHFVYNAHRFDQAVEQSHHQEEFSNSYE